MIREIREIRGSYFGFWVYDSDRSRARAQRGYRFRICSQSRLTSLRTKGYDPASAGGYEVTMILRESDVFDLRFTIYDFGFESQSLLTSAATK